MNRKKRHWLNKRQERIKTKAAAISPKSRSLFHYTSAEGLLGIVSSNTIYATHFGFLNDTTECSLILDVLLPRLEAELRDITPKLVDLKFLKPEILTDFSDAFYRQEADKMLQAMVKTTNKLSPYFIASFCIHDPASEAYQHGLLSQWRGYARGGFAIEFDEIKIDELNDKEKEAFRYQGILTNEVNYRNHETMVTSDQFAGFAGTLLKHLFPKDQDKISEVLGTKSTEDFAKPFLSTTPFLKNASFEEEAEYRIVALCNRPSVMKGVDARPAKEIKFRARADGQVIPYIALYEGLKIRLPIKSIIIGPHVNRDSQRAAVEILLEKYGLDVPIRISEVPFRG